MGNPRFYYSPGDLAEIEEVDLGESLQDLQEDPAAVRADSFGGDGSFYTQYGGQAFMVRIMLERFGTAGASSLERKLNTMLNHLQRGGVVCFSRDHAKTWCSFMSSNYLRGTTAIGTLGNMLSGLSAFGAVAASDEVVIESEEPWGFREVRSVSSVSGTTVTLGEGLVYPYNRTAGLMTPMVRWRDFYPGLYLRAEDSRDQKVRSDARRNWTLDLPLYWSPSSFIGAFYQAQPVGSGLTPTAAGYQEPYRRQALPIGTAATKGMSLGALLGSARRKYDGKSGFDSRRGELA
jgi:hypothetical protein